MAREREEVFTANYKLQARFLELKWLLRMGRSREKKLIRTEKGMAYELGGTRIPEGWENLPKHLFQDWLGNHLWWRTAKNLNHLGGKPN